MPTAAKRGGRDRAKERFWRGEVRGWRRSGLSVRGWCRQRQLSEPSFYSWRRTLSQRDGATAQGRAAQATPAFVALTTCDGVRGVTDRRVPLAEPEPRVEAALELIHPAGHVLRIRRGCDPQTLAMVLGALSAGPLSVVVAGEGSRC
jgi:hypothetical protein